MFPAGTDLITKASSSFFSKKCLTNRKKHDIIIKLFEIAAIYRILKTVGRLRL